MKIDKNYKFKSYTPVPNLEKSKVEASKVEIRNSAEDRENSLKQCLLNTALRTNSLSFLKALRKNNVLNKNGIVDFIRIHNNDYDGTDYRNDRVLLSKYKMISEAKEAKKWKITNFGSRVYEIISKSGAEKEINLTFYFNKHIAEIIAQGDKFNISFYDKKRKAISHSPQVRKKQKIETHLTLISVPVEYPGYEQLVPYQYDQKEFQEKGIQNLTSLAISNFNLNTLPPPGMYPSYQPTGTIMQIRIPNETSLYEDAI